MTTELYRSETAINALSSKSLQWDSWALDSLTALGMSAIRNPLGDRLIHFINSPSAPRAFEITLMISSRLIADGGDKARTLDQAFQAFEYWNGRHCLHCGGRGVLNFNQDECGRCGGTGDRPIPSEYSEPVRKAISLLIEAENWMENQLRARLSKETA